MIKVCTNIFVWASRYKAERDHTSFCIIEFVVFGAIIQVSNLDDTKMLQTVGSRAMTTDMYTYGYGIHACM